jgi:two-component system, LytTR family, response regulator
MNVIRTLIVDDERLARERLRSLLTHESDVEVIGECSSGTEALRQIDRRDPDLVFLDIQMPEVDGFDVVAQIGTENCPAIVFVTAFDAFALRAFETGAIDYLLKPVGEERLRATLQRAKERARRPVGERFEATVPALVDAVGRGGWRDRLSVRIGNRFQIIRVDDLLWIEGANNYVRLWTKKGSYLYRATMTEIANELDPAKFLRVHRSRIVNVEAVQYIEPWGLGEHIFVLEDGTKLNTSRRYRVPIRKLFDC